MAALVHLPRPRPRLHAVPPLPARSLHLTPRPAPRPARLVVLDCPACGLHAEPLILAEADQAAGIHDDLRHDGVPTAVITDDPDPGRTHPPVGALVAAGPDLDGAA